MCCLILIWILFTRDQMKWNQQDIDTDVRESPNHLSEWRIIIHYFYKGWPTSEAAFRVRQITGRTQEGSCYGLSAGICHISLWWTEPVYMSLMSLIRIHYSFAADDIWRANKGHLQWQSYVQWGLLPGGRICARMQEESNLALLWSLPFPFVSVLIKSTKDSFKIKVPHSDRTMENQSCDSILKTKFCKNSIYK